MNKISTGANDLKALQLEANVAASAKLFSLKKMNNLLLQKDNQARYGLNLYGSSRTEAATKQEIGYIS
jgi:hypothetical protein